VTGSLRVVAPERVQAIDSSDVKGGSVADGDLLVGHAVEQHQTMRLPRFGKPDMLQCGERAAGGIELPRVR